MRTSHDIKLGIMRLMIAPRDVKPDLEFSPSDLPLEKAASTFCSLFQHYIADFVDVYELVSEVWESDLDELVEDGSSIEEAIQIKLDNCAAGPAEHPNLIWLVRKYWLSCAQLNTSISVLERVQPEVFLLKWLIDQERSDYVQLLTAMPYWPIGLDENGNWC